jgi:hypothetical protein
MVKIIDWLGKTPRNIKDLSKGDLAIYFAYIYEYYWNREHVEAHGTVEKYIDNLLVELEEDNLSNEKTWWGIVLLTLRDLAELQNYTYINNVIEKVINNLQDLSLEELETYCNNINRVFIGEGSKTLIVRPFEMGNLCGEEALIVNKFKPYLEVKDDVIAELEKYITNENLNMDYIGAMFLSNKEKTSKYSPVITQYCEFLFSYFRTAYENVKADPRMVKLSVKQKVRLVVGSFLEVSIKPMKPIKKLEDLKDGLTEIFIKLK